jgi:hypothetical protein
LAVAKTATAAELQSTPQSISVHPVAIIQNGDGSMI